MDKMLGSQRRTTIVLLGATLATSAVHFADNAFRLDLYPGPICLTKNIVLLAWLVLPLLAWLAYRSESRLGLVVYGLFGFAGFAHYLVQEHRPSSYGHAMPLRCGVTIFGEAIASATLIIYVLMRDPFGAHLSAPQKLPSEKPPI